MARPAELIIAQRKRTEIMDIVNDTKLRLDQELEHYRATEGGQALERVQEQYARAKKKVEYFELELQDMERQLGKSENIKEIAREINIARENLLLAKKKFDVIGKEMKREGRKHRETQVRRSREYNRSLFNKYCVAVDPSSFTLKAKPMANRKSWGEYRIPWDVRASQLGWIRPSRPSWRGPSRGSAPSLGHRGAWGYLPTVYSSPVKATYGYKRPSKERKSEVENYIRFSAIRAIEHSKYSVNRSTTSTMRSSGESAVSATSTVRSSSPKGKRRGGPRRKSPTRSRMTGIKV